MNGEKDFSLSCQTKGDTTYCKNWRGITLLATASKVLNKIILDRMKAALDSLLRDEQAGFRQERSCTDQIATLRIIIEQSLEWNTGLYLVFVDFEKAFDSVDRDVIWQILWHYGVPEKIVNVAHKAAAKSLQRSLSCAIIDASLEVRPSLPFSFASTDLLHVNRGLLRLRLPSGVQNRASLVMSFWGFLRTWPIQLHLLLASSTMMSSWLRISLTLLLLIFMGHLIRRIILKHLCTNTLSLWVISLEIFQYFEPYNRFRLTFESKSLILVFKEITVDLQTCRLQ